MGDGKLHHYPRKKCRETRYPSAPPKPPSSPPDFVPVHFMDGNLFAICRTPGAGHRSKTYRRDHVTCPACLKKMNKSMVMAEASYGVPLRD